jgi:hypothetical protein
MSRARHKLTGIRHALHNAKTTVDSGSNGTDIVIGGDTADGGGGGGGWGNTADADSYIWKKMGGPVHNDDGTVPYGEISDWHDNLELKVGSHYNWHVGSQTLVYRMLWNVDLFAAENVNLNSNTVITNAVLRLTVSDGKSSSYNGGPSNHMNTKRCNIYRNRQTLPDDIDVSYSWWFNWGPLVINEWGTEGAENTAQDIDTTISSFVMLRPQADSNGDGGLTWEPGDKVDIDFTQLVQDAVTNRNGLLKTIWIKEDDDQGSHPEQNLANTTHFFSGNMWQASAKPTLTIDWHNP